MWEEEKLKYEKEIRNLNEIINQLLEVKKINSKLKFKIFNQERNAEAFVKQYYLITISIYTIKTFQIIYSLTEIKKDNPISFKFHIFRQNSIIESFETNFENLNQSNLKLKEKYNYSIYKYIFMFLIDFKMIYR